MQVTCCRFCVGERSADCHSTCQKYLAAKRELAEQNRIIKEKKKSDKLYNSYFFDRKKTSVPVKTLENARKSHVGIQPVDDV